MIQATFRLTVIHSNLKLETSFESGFIWSMQSHKHNFAWKVGTEEIAVSLAPDVWNYPNRIISTCYKNAWGASFKLNIKTLPLYISIAALQKNEGSLDLRSSLHLIICTLCCSLYEVSLKSSSKFRLFCFAQCSLIGPDRRNITLPGSLGINKWIRKVKLHILLAFAFYEDFRQSSLFHSSAFHSGILSS